MFSPDHKIKLFNVLKSTTGEDPWSLQRIGIKIDYPVKSTKQKNALRYQIKKLKKYSELEYLANIGRGYFIPKYEYEFEDVYSTLKNRANGMFETANKYKEGIYKAKKSQRDHEQLELDLGDLEVK